MGDDALADQLREANKREGLHERYLVKKGEETGACAVVLTDHNRCVLRYSVPPWCSITLLSSLVTTLRAAEKFEKSHLSSPEVAPLVDAAKVFYVEGFFLTHGTESVLEVSKKASAASKVSSFPHLHFSDFSHSSTSQVFAMNLSAPFIPQFFGTQLASVFPYCDIVIGNETEAESYAQAAGLKDPKDLVATAKAIATLPKANKRPRIVIITHGPKSTVLVSSEDPEKVKEYQVSAIPDEQIVDTNGAGDAFAGGFLGAFVAGRTIDECVEVGHKLGAMSVQLVCIRVAMIFS